MQKERVSLVSLSTNRSKRCKPTYLVTIDNIFAGTVHLSLFSGLDNWSTSTKGESMHLESYGPNIFSRLTVITFFGVACWTSSRRGASIEQLPESFSVSVLPGTGCTVVLLSTASVEKLRQYWNARSSIGSTTDRVLPFLSWRFCGWHRLSLLLNHINLLRFRDFSRERQEAMPTLLRNVYYAAFFLPFGTSSNNK